jgi:hypothetical protein
MVWYEQQHGQQYGQQYGQPWSQSPSFFYPRQCVGWYGQHTKGVYLSRHADYTFFYQQMRDVEPGDEGAGAYLEWRAHLQVARCELRRPFSMQS